MNGVSADPLRRISELPEVDAAVRETRAVVDRLLGHRVLRRHSADVSMEAALRGAWGSARLEGAEVALDEMRAGAGADARVRGALRVSAELGTLVATWRRAPRQALARLHVLAAADAVPAERLGRPRADGEDAEDPLGLGTPPGAAEVARRLDALSWLLAAPASVPALVVGALVHGELLALRPFGWADGIAARAAERLTLVERGLDPKSLVPTELGHAELREEYGAAVRGYVGGTPEGVAAWVVHCSQAVTAGARESLAACEALRRG
ncbi:Fic family protein [Marinitenerispora sediminis]|uniref:Oxidoreductase n=1 Tax=Marinitenerispora sediminis TaxID=1931232 RepID=A0A368TBM5_9ACTN|nr:oxidoreductase [Marinitenerispora sediminis]RCV57369.1 oxidoreductase [Marinitenerispora sediminis]RCV62351.1 oxidoreductase [Marinitenerispora sediminis]